MVVIRGASGGGYGGFAYVSVRLTKLRFGWLGDRKSDRVTSREPILRFFLLAISVLGICFIRQ